MLLPIKPICPALKVRINGTSFIFLQYCYSQRHRTLLNTGIAIPPGYWMEKQLKISERLPAEYGNSFLLNEELTRQLRVAQNLIYHAVKEGIKERGVFVKATFCPTLESSDIGDSQQGTIITIHASTEDQHIKFSYNYLNLPVLIKYQHASGLFAETGPQLGILLNVKFVYDNEGESTNRTYTQPMDFAWSFGLGYKIPKINLGLDIRYNFGITNIDRYGLPNSYPSKNRVFQVGVFYFFKHI